MIVRKKFVLLTVLALFSCNLFAHGEQWFSAVFLFRTELSVFFTEFQRSTMHFAPEYPAEISGVLKSA